MPRFMEAIRQQLDSPRRALARYLRRPISDVRKDAHDPDLFHSPTRSYLVLAVKEARRRASNADFLQRKGQDLAPRGAASIFRIARRQPSI